MKKGEKKFNMNQSKLRYGLIPFEVLEDVVKVLEMGAKKYGDDDWKHVPNAYAEYQESLLRHVMEYRKKNFTDDESGLSHMAHIVCNAMMILWHEKKLTLINLIKDING